MTWPGIFPLRRRMCRRQAAASRTNLLHIITTVSWGLGYFGMPHILLRFMAINDEKNLTLSRRVASVWVVIAMAVAVGIGISGRVLSDTGVIEVLKNADSETVIIRVADLLSKFGILPALLAGLVLAGILASTMSTADSQLLAASSSVSQNLLQEAFHFKLSAKQSMFAGKNDLGCYFGAEAPLSQETPKAPSSVLSPLRGQVLAPGLVRL